MRRLSLSSIARISRRCDHGDMVAYDMARRQTLIQLDDARIAALDQRAAASGKSRSELIRDAIDLLLGTGDTAAVDANIVEGYTRVPPEEPDAFTVEAALASIRAEPW